MGHGCKTPSINCITVLFLSFLLKILIIMTMKYGTMVWYQITKKNVIETYLCYITVNADNFMLIYLFEKTTSTVPLHKLTTQISRVQWPLTRWFFFQLREIIRIFKINKKRKCLWMILRKFLKIKWGCCQLTCQNLRNPQRMLSIIRQKEIESQK